MDDDVASALSENEDAKRIRERILQWDSSENPLAPITQEQQDLFDHLEQLMTDAYYNVSFCLQKISIIFNYLRLNFRLTMSLKDPRILRQLLNRKKLKIYKVKFMMNYMTSTKIMESIHLIVFINGMIGLTMN